MVDGQLTVAELQQRIRRYCADHVNAADTVDGVRRYWLGDPALAADDVGAALSALVAAGSLDRRLLPDGTAIYFALPARG